MDGRKRDQRLTLMKPTYTRGADGSSIPTFTAAATVWAARALKGSREFYAAQKTNAEVEAVFNIQYRSDVNQTWRAVHDGRTYELLGADADNRKTELNLTCREVV